MALDLFHWNCLPELLFDGSNSFICDTTWNNELEETKVSIDIQGETMHGHPPAAANTHGTYLPCPERVIRFQPHTGSARQAITL